MATEEQRLRHIEETAARGVAAINIGDYAQGINHLYNAAALAEAELLTHQEGTTS